MCIWLLIVSSITVYAVSPHLGSNDSLFEDRFSVWLHFWRNFGIRRDWDGAPRIELVLLGYRGGSGGIDESALSPGCAHLLQEVRDFFSPTLASSRSLCDLFESSVRSRFALTAYLNESNKSFYLATGDRLVSDAYEVYIQNDSAAAIVYRLDGGRLYLDFQAGDLLGEENHFVANTLKNGTYKTPYKTISYNVEEGKFSRGVIYPEQTDDENAIAHFFNPVVFRSTEYVHSPSGESVQYNYAGYVGIDLLDAINGRKIDDKRSFFLALKAQVASLHVMGIRHNDLKPANIFVDNLRLPVLGDFGFAIRTDAPDLVDGCVGGSIGYVYVQVSAHCNPLEDGYQDVCNAIRKSACIDLYALGKIAEKLALEDSSLELAQCDAWVDSLFSKDRSIRARALMVPEVPG